MSVSATMPGPSKKKELLEQAMLEMEKVIDVNKIAWEKNAALQEQNDALKTVHAEELDALKKAHAEELDALQEQNDALKTAYAALKKEHAKKDEEDFPEQGDKIAALQEKLEQVEHNCKILGNDSRVFVKENKRLQGKLQQANRIIEDLKTESPEKVTPEEVTPEEVTSNITQVDGPPSVWGQPKPNKPPPTSEESAKDTTDVEPSVEELRRELPTGPSGKSTAPPPTTLDAPMPTTPMGHRIEKDVFDAFVEIINRVAGKDEAFLKCYECDKGDKCEYYKDGRCKFFHPTKENPTAPKGPCVTALWYGNWECTNPRCKLAHGVEVPLSKRNRYGIANGKCMKVPIGTTPGDSQQLIANVRKMPKFTMKLAIKALMQFPENSKYHKLALKYHDDSSRMKIPLTISDFVTY